MDQEGEKLLCLTAEEIYTIASTKMESQPMKDDQLKMQDNFFKIQVKKSFSHSTHTTSAKIFILSVKKKENMLPSLPAPSNINVGGDNKRHKKYVLSSGQQAAEPKERHHVLKQKQKMEPPNQPKCSKSHQQNPSLISSLTIKYNFHLILIVFLHIPTY